MFFGKSKSEETIREEQQSAELEAQKIALKDFFRQYNEITNICFNDCVDSFTSRDVKTSEKNCTENCLDKYLKITQRISQRFQEHQMLRNENQIVAAKKTGIF
ncbi:hypothetical protein SNEBB_010951 [Seison nebaliae]|nr:hypothetical protein SNEBB_010951 [Seison nebaliae]